MSRRSGFGLIELIVSLTILAVGVLGLAAAAVLAQRSFTAAETTERAARVAGALLDSLAAEASPTSGMRAARGMTVRWLVAQDSVQTSITAEVDVVAAGRPRHFTFAAIHGAR